MRCFRTKYPLLLIIATGLLLAAPVPSVRAGDAPMLAEISMLAGNFAPRGWALCQGQILSINTYQSLFSLLGATFGGDGRVTFALPDLRGRAPMGTGNGPGLSSRTLGEWGGAETVALSTSQIPPHNHQLRGATVQGNTGLPTDHVWASTPSGQKVYLQSVANPDATMANGAIATSGGGQAHNNMPPWLAINYIISLNGYFPPRH